MNAPASDAVGWHDQIAENFSQGYDRSPRFQERFRLWQALIAAHVRPGDTVLDAGCGAGTFSFEAAKPAGQVDAIDGSANMIALCRDRQQAQGIQNIAFETALLESISARPQAHYDVVLCSSVLEYLPDLRAELKRLIDALKPGGRLIFSLPNGESRYRKLEGLAFRLTGRPRYFEFVRNVVTADRASRLIGELGCRVMDTHYFAAPPVPMSIAPLFGTRPKSKTLFAMVAVKGGSDQSVS